MDFWAGSQSTGGLFGRDIPLGFGQKFETVCLFSVMSLQQDKIRTQPETFEQRNFAKAGGKSGHVDGLCWFHHRRYPYTRPLEG